MRAITITTLSLSLTLSLVACSSEPASHNDTRGVLSDPGPVKADGTNSCANICGEQAPSGCWCDDACVNYADCCADRQALCGGPAPATSCDAITCAAGFHCEMKGINGGAIPVCIADAVIVTTCADLGGYCLPLTYPASECNADETADTTAGLCGGMPGQTTTCCVKTTPPAQTACEAKGGYCALWTGLGPVCNTGFAPAADAQGFPMSEGCGAATSAVYDDLCCLPVAAPETCDTFKCDPGYHCEMKGINGGSVPVCIADAP